MRTGMPSMVRAISELDGSARSSPATPQGALPNRTLQRTALRAAAERHRVSRICPGLQQENLRKEGLAREKLAVILMV
ncbi:MAG: hypothetical protein QOI66_1479 [Myxococcales bacterium]|nr:hypothetical protein [Myxococcales bacterium]